MSKYVFETLYGACICVHVHVFYTGVFMLFARSVSKLSKQKILLIALGILNVDLNISQSNWWYWRYL